MRDRNSPDAGLPKAFKIGLKPVTRDGSWLRPFSGMAQYLSEKNMLFERERPAVFGDVGGTQHAQSEIYALLVKHLLSSFPHVYHEIENDIFIAVDAQRFVVSPCDEPALLTASRLVGDDLVIMKKTADGWALAAGSVCFPSVWKLREKLGRVMADVHEPVPGFQPGSRHAEIVERIFDNLPIGETVQRENWSLHDVSLLHLPQHAPLKNGEIAGLFIRGEIQTLTKLSSGNEILFTIGVFVDPLVSLKTRSTVAKQLREQIAGLNQQELTYKGLSDVREKLHEQLSALTGNQ